MAQASHQTTKLTLQMSTISQTHITGLCMSLAEKRDHTSWNSRPTRRDLLNLMGAIIDGSILYGPHFLIAFFQRSASGLSVRQVFFISLGRYQ